ncbi:hypothetical protein [Bacillus haynesii]|uniref:hypothetical protein n=1 Tax=Bacillus haynesii TaxID=1925021 RepID=UPI002282CC53|nr:hypothetical protein [Bacillus haynesii]MCY8576819.1 hypothetical protein [Bacillus haynesii]MCY8712349.1 hypothetical protein [Bacillus haynesii]MCY9147510.1 hypothetical protein [Bacillus haynesii]MCY9317023.1 hypothetical protein [Bacillus haynesii]MCY9332468.1 hypothetical protein [Bacillus haynesii]
MQKKQNILELRLYDNAIDFINKSTESFILADEGKLREFKYAILLLANGVELVLKSILEDKHPLFINESLDNGKNTTVKAENLVKRINLVYEQDNKMIKKTEAENFKAIREIRNQIIHKDVIFTSDNHPTELYAKTLYSLDIVVRNFKGNILSHVIDSWDDIVLVEEIQKNYHSHIEGITIDGTPIPCPLCSIEKLIEDNGQIRCFNCNQVYNSLEEAIMANPNEDLIDDLLFAFKNELISQNIKFDECPKCGIDEYSWFDPNDNSIHCFNCGVIDSNLCSKCNKKSAYIIKYDIGYDTENEIYCMNCAEYIDTKLCSGCYQEKRELHYVVIDVNKTHPFKIEFPTLEYGNSPFIHQYLCKSCIQRLEYLANENAIELLNG